MSRAIRELTLKPRVGSKEMKADVLERAMSNPVVDPARHHVAFREVVFGVLDASLEKLSMAFARKFLQQKQ